MELMKHTLGLFLAGLTALPLVLKAEPDFAKEILPILRDNCVKCHGAEKQKGKLRLDSKAAAFKGGKSGKASIVAGKPDESDLVRRVLLPKADEDTMPPEGDRLSEAAVKLLKDWIGAGAKWPDDLAITANEPPSSSTSTAPLRPKVPEPVLPKDFKPGPAEAAAVATLAKAGVNVRPLAQNIPWTEANFRLMGTNITDAQIAPIKDLPSLVELRLGNTRVTDESLALLDSLPNLQVLSLELTSVTDAGVAHVKNLPNLTYLNLYGTAVTDAIFEHLRDKKHLRSLYLWQTKVTAEAVKKMQEALPGLDINTGAQLVMISTNAPAEKKEDKKEDKKEEKK